MKKIFVMDDDVNIALLIKKYLENEGFAAEVFHNGEDALGAVSRSEPDMYVLDIMMPGTGGLDLCREIRKKGNTPIIFVSAKGEELDRVLGLELGADDYLTKPFSPRELVVRVKNIFRRLSESRTAAEYRVADLTVNPGMRSARVGDKEVDLTAKEYQLLELLAVNPGYAFSRQQILDRVWGIDYVGDNRAVDDLVKRVRKKIKEQGSSAQISTVWGYGYKING
ncbi:MAG: response regulator transcription factor [Bacillota bacterium]